MELKRRLFQSWMNSELGYNGIMKLYELSEFSRDHKSWFYAIANQLLQSKLYIGEDKYKIIDVSIHYTSNSYSNPHCHEAGPQGSNGKWYYFNNDIQILDFTFCNEQDQSSRGGVLLRGIESESKTLNTITKIHTEISERLGASFLSSVNGKSALNGDLKIKLAEKRKFIPCYSLPRPRLSMQSESHSDLTTAKSAISPLRFSRYYPSNIENGDFELLIIYSYLHNYMAELNQYFEKDIVEMKLNDFREFINRDDLEELIDKEDLVVKFLKRKILRKNVKN